MYYSEKNKPILDAAKAAFPYSSPMIMGFLFLGASYGIYTHSLGFNFIYPMLTAMLIYGGSVEFIVVGMTLLPFAPLQVFLLTLMISSRQIFYSISMLEKYGRHLGKKRWYLVSATVDESFSLNYMAKIPPTLDKGWYMFFVTLYLHIYWVVGATIGNLFTAYSALNLQGVEFAMTALFLVIFVENWLKEQSHEASLLGIGITILCLVFFGKDNFLIPTLLGILTILSFRRFKLSSKLTEID